MTMTRCAIEILVLCLLLTCAGYAQGSNPSALPAVPSCPDYLLRACDQAAAELDAARKLIAAQDAELKAAREALEAQKERARLLAEQNGILQAQLLDLREAAAARAAQIKAMEELIGKYQIRITDLETALAKQKRRTRQSALAGFLGGVLAGVAVGR